MTSSFSISEYKFEQAYDSSKAVVVINALLFFILATRGIDYLVSHPYTWVSILCSLIFLLSYKLYDWRSSVLNFCMILLYAAFLLYEFGVFGIPGYVVNIESRTMSKGFLLDAFLGILPYCYLGLRIAAIFCLIPVWWYSREIS